MLEDSGSLTEQPRKTKAKMVYGCSCIDFGDLAHKVLDNYQRHVPQSASKYFTLNQVALRREQGHFMLATHKAEDIQPLSPRWDIA